MCWIFASFNSWYNKFFLKKQLEKLSHRWPDNIDFLYWEKFFLWHTRLSIQDLSSNWNQPFIIWDYIIIFNGEIYNFKELINEHNLKVKTWTDTEVLLLLYIKYGSNCLKYFNGAFSFIIYNKKNWEYFMARDRLWIKPLFYYKKNQEFYLSSEIKPLLFLTKEVEFNIDNLKLDLYLYLFWNRKDKTYFKNIFSLNPWTYIKWNINDKKIVFKKYWDLDWINVDLKNLIRSDLEKLVREKFEKAVYYRTISDVKFSSFLSWWLDSTAINWYLIQNWFDFDILTTAYKWNENEDLVFAKKMISKYKKNKNHIVNIIEKETYSLELIDKVTYFMEEPLWDKVYIPIFLNYKKLREKWYKVVLNWQWSDELWCWYLYTYDLYKYILLEKWESIEEFFSKKIDESNIPVLEKDSLKLELKKYVKMNIPTKWDIFKKLTYFTIQTHLLNILLQEDKLSMASSIECRLPFCDHNLYELWYNIDEKYKIEWWNEKDILKKALKKYVIKEIYNRKKQAFPHPKKFDFEINIIKDNIESIKKSKILNNIFDDFPNYIKDYLNIKWEILWKIIALWRFEKVFKV